MYHFDTPTITKTAQNSRISDQQIFSSKFFHSRGRSEALLGVIYVNDKFTLTRETLFPFMHIWKFFFYLPLAIGYEELENIIFRMPVGIAVIVFFCVLPKFRWLWAFV